LTGTPSVTSSTAHVWRNWCGVTRLSIPRPVGEPRQHNAHVAIIQPTTGERAEQAAAAPLERLAPRMPALHDRLSASIQADDAGLAALAAEHAQRAGRVVDVGWFEVQRLGDAETRAPEHGQQRAVTHAGRGARGTLLEEPFDLGSGERFDRERAALVGRRLAGR